MSGAATLETHITGARAHGRCTLMAIDCGEYPHDSNLTIEIILRLFHELKVNRRNIISESKCQNLMDVTIAGDITPSAISTNG